MIDFYQDVHDFHEKFGCYIGGSPSEPGEGEIALRRGLISEEYEELDEAMAAGDLVEIADAIADSIYVLLGTAVSYGIDLRPIWGEVHRSNMAKTGSKRADGKVTKGAGWTPPDVVGLLLKQGAKLS